ncbi:putative E3 ubiquitin-protein ligase ZNRF2 [Hypsibius exemplaris]|uniref:RING-type E3 ubiquitin transferase n=1 Tax=Hypsibius exemplaris TaxID=2072580 RepID=A0A9X6NFX4_HYPEX|nr:putative E3 ubiquitin-protein ligase ZNRF2 [Hypsibius exemplaris]
MGAKPSTQQPIRPRSDTFPHGNSTTTAASSNGAASGTSTPFHHPGSAAGPSQRHSSGSRVGATSADAAAVRRLRSMSAVEALTASQRHHHRQHHNRSTLSGSDSDDSSPETENSQYAHVVRIPGSLPLRLFQLAGIKCPVCNKQITSDNVELHLVECLTKPRIIYNEEVLIEPKGECIICFDDMAHGQTIARLPCLCIYHKRCIDCWFRVNRTCPEHPGE